MPMTPESIPYQHEYTTDAGHPRRLAAAMTRHLLLTGPQAILTAFLLALGTVGLLGAVLDLSRGFSPAPGLILTGVTVGVAVLLAAIVFVVLDSQFRRAFPIGSRYAFGFGTDAFALRLPTLAGGLELQPEYRSFKRVLVRGDFLLLRGRGGQRLVLPLPLLPGLEHERLMGFIEATR